MLPRGTRIGQYVVQCCVSAGLMSEVYEGRHVDGERRVAIKVLSAELDPQEELAARFLNEAHVLQRLRHAHLVEALEPGTLPDGRPFVVLEWLPMDLHRLLRRAGGRLPLRTVVRIGSQLTDVMALLHERGIIHRDLKPANVLLAHGEPETLHIKLADLGLAKLLPQEDEPLSAVPVSTVGNTRLGTLDYMAPEQWKRSKSVDPKADVYALGVLLFEMLAGRLPFLPDEENDLMYLHLIVPPPLDLLEGLAPADLRGLISRMLNKKPAPRPTMREVLEQLTQG
jgi:eukaryotic-like serine/threonine-protein kinase